MPSSTSSSDHRAATRAIATLLGGVLLYCIGLEVVTRKGFSRVSRTQRRIAADLLAAKSVAPSAPSVPSTILVVGNSLLLDGVDRASLKSDLSANYEANLLPVENTQFEDWYFGLRRLFAEGSRPAVVVVCLSTRQMMSSATDGEYFAYYLMQGRDLPAVKRESQLDNTLASTYFFANLSDWLGSRAQIRNWLLQAIMPNLEHLISFFPAKTPPMPPRDQVLAAALPHLAALNELCRTNGARIVVVVPPTLSHEDASADLETAAAQKGIAFLVPLRSDDVTPAEFHDGFHLNARGATRFTHRLAADLLQKLSAN